MHNYFPLQTAKGCLVNLQKTDFWTRCPSVCPHHPSVSSPFFWGHPCSAHYPINAFIWYPQLSCLQKWNNNHFISLQTISAAALVPHILSELLGRGLRGAVTTLVPSPPSAAETFAFHRHQLLCQSFPHTPLHQIWNLWQAHGEGAGEHWGVQELQEKSDIQEQITSNHRAVFPLISP